MVWNKKDLDPKALSAALLAAMKQTLSKVESLTQSQDPTVEATAIIDYEGRMRANGPEKLGSTCYVSVVNFYVNQSDMEHRSHTKGAMVLYLETESAAKFFKGLGLTFAEDEDDASMMSACGNFALRISDNLKEELTRLGYAPVISSVPRNYKNSVLEGVVYSSDQKTKHEISFFYFRHKAIILELTLAPIPKK